MRVMITGAGGSRGRDIARSLAGRDLVGLDSTEAGQVFSLCRVTDYVRSAERPDFLASLRAQVEQYGPAVLFVNPDPEIERVAAEAPDLAALTPIPSPDAVAVCMDKRRTCQTCGTHAPFAPTGGSPICAAPWWVRPARGAGGVGSFLARTLEELVAWRTLHPRVTDWCVSAYLPGKNLNVSLAYWRGDLVCVGASERWGYLLAGASASGVTGEVSDIVTVDRPDAVQAAQAAVKAIPGERHGFYGVDLREDANGRPCVTEINPRLAGRPWLYANAGADFAGLWCALVDGRAPGPVQTARAGVRELRAVDAEPVVEDMGAVV